MFGRLCRTLACRIIWLYCHLRRWPQPRRFLLSSQADLPHRPRSLQPALLAAPFRRRIQDYTRGKRWFPNILAPYTQAVVPEPVLLNSPRIEQMVQNGKLSISLQDAIDLALQNNLSISVERYVPWLAEASILHTLSGGTPTSGSVGALGTIPALNFDPQVTSTFSLDQRSLPVNNPLTAGIVSGN